MKREQLFKASHMSLLLVCYSQLFWAVKALAFH